MMYYPYLRGRQYELLALRDLVSAAKKPFQYVHPIIEPVRFSSTLRTTLTALTEVDSPVGLIFNPAVGIFYDELKLADRGSEQLDEWRKDERILKIMSFEQDFVKTVKTMGDLFPDMKTEMWGGMFFREDALHYYDETMGDSSFRINFIPDSTPFRRKFINQKRVLFQDHFNRQSRNRDYQLHEKEFFSEDHLFAAAEGYAGVGDYSMVGGEYIDSGFSPYAVAIHLVYPTQDKRLFVRHFISDRTDGIEDLVGKFFEACDKLVDWVETSGEYLGPQTRGLNEFRRCLEEKRYPGLGSVKKFSIMHHIEVMEHLLAEK